MSRTRKSDLVVLRWLPQNDLYTEVVSVEKAEVFVSLKHMTWRYEGWGYVPGQKKFTMMQIGQSCTIREHSCNHVIGVYDRRSLKQLSSMVRDAQEATDTSEGSVYD